MRKQKKKIVLVPFLTLYTMFMPFVMVNCGHDVAYTTETEEEGSSEADTQLTVEECQEREAQGGFTTEECVDLLIGAEPPAP